MSTTFTQMSNPAADRSYLANVAIAARALVAALFGARPASVSQALPQHAPSPAWTPDVSHFQSNRQQMPNLSAELRFLASRG